MKLRRTLRVLLVLALAVAVLLSLEASGLAQCSMCRASLAGSNNANFIRNFNIGVLVLLVPPVSIFCGFFIALKRHKREEVRSQEPEVGRENF